MNKKELQENRFFSSQALGFNLPKPETINGVCEKTGAILL